MRRLDKGSADSVVIPLDRLRQPATRQGLGSLPPGTALSPADLASPVLLKGLAHWQRLAAERRMPARKDLDPADIPELLPHISLLEVRRLPLDFRYRLVGTTVRMHSSADYTGRWMSELPHQGPASVVWRVCAWVANSGAPLLLRPPYAGPQKDFLSVEAAILPLSGDQENRAERLLIFADFFRKDPAAL